MNYVKYVLEALDKLSGIRVGYKSLAIYLETKSVTIECRNGKSDLRVYEWGGYQRYWPSVPSRDKRKISEECRKLLEFVEEYGAEEIGEEIGGEVDIEEGYMKKG